MHCGVEIHMAHSQDNELRSKHLLPFYILPRRCRCSYCSYCTSTKKRSLTCLVLRRPIVGSSSIWTVIHKSQTCILVHAGQWDNQNRHELRDSSTSRRNNPNEDIVNFNFELILHHCDLQVFLYALPLCYKLYNAVSLIFIINKVNKI